MQIEVNSRSKVISDENHDSYLLSLEPEKAVALTMNFPQYNAPRSEIATIESNSMQRQISNKDTSCNHITTDPHGCLDCISTMFGPNYAPFAAFSRLFHSVAV